MAFFVMGLLLTVAQWRCLLMKLVKNKLSNSGTAIFNLSNNDYHIQIKIQL
ncbi:hypothetical protein Mar181_1370 [Marinomonas posidonica IVIA-Po-181]|uniref:Uncharacterized protein n=1 Tax=Marinomonas posidonica (strain CECT 7376 / NCIMB 14433 / IVIA-Po-181) TaxID=491952 RepID=F6CWR3_MARPP|nr:hypothetical protein Mar181_1370 [Marinomonas posidonica IVIA-Po-181]